LAFILYPYPIFFPSSSRHLASSNDDQVKTPTDNPTPATNNKPQETNSWDYDISISKLTENLLLHIPITKKNKSCFDP